MGPVSAKLQATRDAPLESVLNLFVTTELDDLKQKYNRLSFEQKQKFESILGGVDSYDILETADTAKEFLETLDKKQKEDLVTGVFSFMEENEIDLNEPESAMRMREDGEKSDRMPVV